jgi:hypothetical protein
LRVALQDLVVVGSFLFLEVEEQESPAQREDG